MSGIDATRLTRWASGMLDGPVLVGSLVAGAFWLGVLAFLSWPLAVIGAVYVAAASLFFGAVYARPTLTKRHEAATWVAPWLAATALWTWVIAGFTGGPPTPLLLDVWIGLLVATPCYVAWQVSSLAVRQLLAWRFGFGRDAAPWSPAELAESQREIANAEAET